MRRSLTGLALLATAACADPAAVEVRISVEEPGVDTVSLRVTAGEETPVDCRLPLDGAPEGQCPFEAGEGRWSDAGSLAFVLYGEPGLPFEVSVDGERVGVSVTATAAQTSLPMSEGERRVVQLSLLGRTRARYSCQLDLPTAPEGPETFSDPEHTALAVLTPFAEPRAALLGPVSLLVSSHKVLSQVIYARTPEGCTLEARALEDPRAAAAPIPEERRWCSLRGGALAARALPDGGAILLAGVCADPAARRLKLAVLSTREVLIGTVTLDPDIVEVSDPVIAASGVDGRIEVSALLRASGGAVSLGRVMFDASGPTTAVLPLPRVVWPEGVRHGPLVAPAANPGQELLVVAGYGGQAMVYEAGAVEGAGLGPRSLRPPVGYALEGRLGVMGLDGAAAESQSVSHGLFARTLMGWRRIAQPAVSLGASLAADPDAPLTLGRATRGAPPLAVLFEAGVAYQFAVGATSVNPPLDVWGGAASGAQRSLWANLDGRAGAELISFTPRGSGLAAVRADGAALDGWPLNLAATGASRRVALADLDGISGRNEDGLRDVEVLSLSDRRLTVVTLGPGSYDPAGMDWPVPRGAPNGSMVWTGTGDPTRTPPP